MHAGALLGIGVDASVQGEQVAGIVIQILTGAVGNLAKASSPTQFSISVNLIVADKIGVSLPDELVKRASQVTGGTDDP